MATPDGPESRRSRLARAPDAYDRFSAAVDIPLTVITIAWLPVLIIPFVAPFPRAGGGTFAVLPYMVWALFFLGYFVNVYLSPSRWHFFKTHILDLLIVAVPFFRPLRVGRLARLARLARVGVVLARGIGRAKELLSHKGLHFALLTVAMIIFASAGLVMVAER